MEQKESRRTLENLKEKHSDLKSQCTRLRAEIERAQKEIAKAQGDLMGRGQNVEALREENDVLRQQLKEQELGQLLSLRNQVEEKKEENRALKTQVSIKEGLSAEAEQEEEELNQMKENLDMMKKIETRAGGEYTYNRFLGKGRPSFPLDGNSQQKIEWLQAFHGFLKGMG